jgi:F-type H+-transporting ATPase subunit delta
MRSKATRRYSLALYGLAEERGKIEEVSKDINLILDLMKSNHDLELFFASPIIPKNKKLQIVKEVFSGKVSDLIMTFINLLVNRGRSNLAKETFSDFLQLKNEREGVVNVQVKTCVELNDREKELLKNKIDSFTTLKSKLSFELDKAIIGGFVAKINDTILDASIKRQLENLRKRFKEGDFILN